MKNDIFKEISRTLGEIKVEYRDIFIKIYKHSLKLVKENNNLKKENIKLKQELKKRSSVCYKLKNLKNLWKR